MHSTKPSHKVVSLEVQDGGHHNPILGRVNWSLGFLSFVDGPPDKLEELTGQQEVLASLLRLLSL